jgi:hypothetical protein
VQRDFTVEGSYIIFAFTHGESGFAIRVRPANEVPFAAIAGAAGAVVVLLLAGWNMKKRRAAKKGSGSEEQ